MSAWKTSTRTRTVRAIAAILALFALAAVGCSTQANRPGQEMFRISHSVR